MSIVALSALENGIINPITLSNVMEKRKCMDKLIIAGKKGHGL